MSTRSSGGYSDRSDSAFSRAGRRQPNRSARDLRQGSGICGDWGADFADAGDLGHIGNEAKLGLWPTGLLLLGRLLEKALV
jgi:predicted alpha/beta hydrolase family esterase